MSYLPRIYKENTLVSASKYPILCLLGPRQCGKTTFARENFAKYEYFDLERPSHLAQVSGDIELFLTSRRSPFIIDEAQRLPELFPALRWFVDQTRQNAQVVLLGSASFKLIKGVSESLAGRVGYIDLSGFHVSEVTSPQTDFRDHWLKGGFPDAYLGGAPNELYFDWFENYTRSLIERDWPALGIMFNSLEFRRLWSMLSLSHADLLNKNKLASSLGVAANTVERYIEILEESFLVRRLEPFHSNLKKRLVKSPKLYLRDSGLLHYFLRILTTSDLLISPHRGASFEGYVVEQICLLVALHTRAARCYFFRTSDGLEVDLLIENQNVLYLVEIKSKSVITADDCRSLIKAHNLLGAARSFCISLGEKSYPFSDSIDVISFSAWVAEGMPAFWTVISKEDQIARSALKI